MREPRSRIGKFRIADHCLRMRLERIDPAIANTVAELFLLSPQDRIGQCAHEGFAQHALLDLVGTRPNWAHALVLGIHAHREIEELQIQERHPSFHAPCRH